MRLVILCMLFTAALLGAPGAFGQTESVPAAQSMEQKLDKARALVHEGQQAAPAAASSEETVASTGVKMIRSLGILVALVFLSAWAYRKFVLKDAPQPARKLRILERTPIAPRASLVLAEVDGNKVLIGLAGDGISMMTLDRVRTAPIELTEEYEKI